MVQAEVGKGFGGFISKTNLSFKAEIFLVQRSGIPPIKLFLKVS